LIRNCRIDLDFHITILQDLDALHGPRKGTGDTPKTVMRLRIGAIETYADAADPASLRSWTISFVSNVPLVAITMRRPRFVP